MESDNKTILLLKEKKTSPPSTNDLSGRALQLLDLAKSFHKDGDLTEEKKILDILIEDEKPDNFYVLYRCAYYWLKIEDYKKAEEYLAKIRKDYFIIDFELQYIKCLNMQNRYDEVDSLLNTYIAAFPEEPKYYESLASVLKKRYQYKKAISAIQKAIQLKDSLDDKVFLISLYYYLGQYKKVIQEIEKYYINDIKNINEDSPKPIKKLVFFYASAFRNRTDNTNYDKYKEIYLKYDKSNTEYYYDLALYHLDLYDEEEAEKCIDQSLKLMKNFIPSVMRKINFLKNRKQFKEAQELETQYKKETEEFLAKDYIGDNDNDNATVTLTSEIPLQSELSKDSVQRIKHLDDKEEKEINFENKEINPDDIEINTEPRNKREGKNSLDNLIQTTHSMNFASKIKIFKKIAELIKIYHENHTLLNLTPLNIVFDSDNYENENIQLIDDNNDYIDLYQRKDEAHTYETDIYSFGMVMIQLLFDKTTKDFKIEELKKQIGKIEEGRNDKQMKAFRKMLIDCQKEKANLRPNIDDIIRILDSLI